MRFELRDNPQYRSITPNEYLEEGTLVWIESFADAYYNVQVEGPFLIIDGWGPLWFGTANQNKPNGKHVVLHSTLTGEQRQISWHSFLNETLYVLQEGLCTDVETK